MIEPIVIALAELVVDDIFECVEGAKRIEFKNSNEKGLGGFNQAELTEFVAKSIDSSLRGESFLARKS